MSAASHPARAGGRWPSGSTRSLPEHHIRAIQSQGGNRGLSRLVPGWLQAPPASSSSHAALCVSHTVLLKVYCMRVRTRREASEEARKPDVTERDPKAAWRVTMRVTAFCLVWWAARTCREPNRKQSPKRLDHLGLYTTACRPIVGEATSVTARDSRDRSAGEQRAAKGVRGGTRGGTRGSERVESYPPHYWHT